MAVYSKLLLSSGGGIISTRQQADQAQNTASILIGLGGTGIDCLRTIKTQVYSRLKADDPEAVVATYSHIRFLGVDTAEKSRGVADTEDDHVKADALMALDDTEFFSIANPNVRRAFSNPHVLKQRTELNWLRWEDIEAPDLGRAGAGGIRQVGRFVMMDKSDLFLSRIEQEINAAKSGLTEPTVNVHIFSGLSGGTGSGCFLDVCYMVRSIADRVGGVTIFGYFFLPDVNLDKIPFTDTMTRAYIPKNGYAAMQELDYCMQLQYNGGSFEQEYQGHRTIEWKTGPVDMCHLICATNAAGDVLTNAYDYAMNVTSEYVMDFLTFSDKAFDLAEQLSNFRQKVRTADGEKVIGSNLAYCVIGASCASIPLREINTYLASELFGCFSTISFNIPSAADVLSLATKSIAGVQSEADIYESLFREIRKDAGDEYAPYNDDWKFVRDYGNKDMVKHYTNQTAEKMGKAETNSQSMMTPSNEKSLLGRVRTQLEDISRDIKRGPIFAYRLISAAEKNNLLNIVDGLIEQNGARWQQESYQSELRFKNYEDAKFNFENRRCRFFMDSDKKRFNDYEFYLKSLEEHKWFMFVYETLDKVLREFRKQLEDIAANYYIKLSRVMETLISTFQENRDALASEKIMTAKGSFAIPMMTIAELKQSLDQEIADIDIPGMLASFMMLLIKNEDQWILEDENKITKLVTEFFVENAFNGFANRTITSFLKDKYGIENDERLANKIYEDWMKLLTAKASPLFYFNGSIWREDQTSKLAFLSIPTTSAPIKAAAKKMFETNSLWEIKESALTDRIYVMCSACALPLSAYNNCEEYEKVCFSTTDSGRHYYEGKPVPGMTFNDWNKLPSLTPQSMLRLEKAPYKMKDIITAGQNLYDEAESKGIFDEENHICKPDPEAIADINALAQDCVDFANKISRNNEVKSAKQKLSQLIEKVKTIPMVQTEFAMPNDGFAKRIETKKLVRKDHFVSSPAYHPLVEEILKDLEKIDYTVQQAQQKLISKIESIEIGNKDLIDYSEALFTGVITWEGLVLTYRQVQHGISNDIILSKRGEEYPFGIIPIYQGFLNYLKLDSDIKAEIKTIVDDRCNSDAPELHSVGAKLKNELRDERVNAWAKIAESYEQYTDINQFLKKIKEQFDIFCMERAL